MAYTYGKEDAYAPKEEDEVKRVVLEVEGLERNTVVAWRRESSGV